MIIRDANNADSEQVKQLVFTVLEEYGLSPDPDTTDRDLDDIEACYFSNGGYFGVIEKDHIIVATVGLYRLDEESCELRKMYIAANQRGSGLGRKLMEFSLKKARESGFKRILLETASPLKEAIALYQKYGFVEYSPEHLSARCDQAFELML